MGDRLRAGIPSRYVTSQLGWQRLQSAQQNTLEVPRYRLTTYGRRACSVAGPSAWNSLHVAFTDPTISDACFQRHLKTVLFAQQRRHKCLARARFVYDYALYKFTFIIIIYCVKMAEPIEMPLGVCGLMGAHVTIH